MRIRSGLGVAPQLRLWKLTRWYRSMASCLLGAEPAIRRRLILRSHQWLAECVFSPHGIRPDAVDSLGPGSPLASALAEMIPATERAVWRPWIRLVLRDLRRALHWPPSRQTDAWCRCLFLIPYSVPAPRRRGAPRIMETQPAPDPGQPRALRA